MRRKEMLRVSSLSLSLSRLFSFVWVSTTGFFPFSSCLLYLLSFFPDSIVLVTFSSRFSSVDGGPRLDTRRFQVSFRLFVCPGTRRRLETLCSFLAYGIDPTASLWVEDLNISVHSTWFSISDFFDIEPSTRCIFKKHSHCAPYWRLLQRPVLSEASSVEREHPTITSPSAMAPSSAAAASSPGEYQHQPSSPSFRETS